MAERHTRVWASQIAEIKPSDAKATNSPGDNQIPKKTAGEDKFTWVDAGVGNVKNDGSVDPTNLLSNGDFENWSAGASVAPDGWALSGAGASVAREATIVKLGTYSAKVTRAGANAILYVFPDGVIGTNFGTNYRDYLKGRTMTLSCWVYATVANRARIDIWDGCADTYSSYHTGDSTWQLLTVTRTFPTNVLGVSVYFYVDTGDTIAYFDGVMCVEGESVFAFSPKPLSGDSSGEINSLTDKASPVDTDVTLIEDNTATPINQKKKLSWSNIKATLKTYFDGIYQAIGTYLSNLVEDTTPQLGGDLDLNGKNIDFPTTPNISDCLDEDNMASNSATKLCTQQSIKAYVDTKAPIASPTFTGIVNVPTITVSNAADTSVALRAPSTISITGSGGITSLVANQYSGFFFIQENTIAADGAFLIFVPASNNPGIIWQSAGNVFTNVKDTANKINVYSEDIYIKIQNNLSTSTIACRILLLSGM